MVDFALTEEQQMVQQTAREFAQETVKPLSEEANAKADPEEAFTMMKPAYEETFELGFAFPYVPEEYGGDAIDHLTFAIAVEEVCAADPGFGCTLLVNTLGQLPLYMFGTDEQKERFLGETVEVYRTNVRRDLPGSNLGGSSAGEPRTILGGRTMVVWGNRDRYRWPRS